MGNWLWAIGYGLLAIGDWLLVIGYRLERCAAIRAFRLIASSPLTSNLIACQRQCFDADATGRCRSGTKQRGSKPQKSSKNITFRPQGDKFGKQFEEHSQLDRREINSMKSSENIVRLFEEHSKIVRRTQQVVRRTLKAIWCDSQTKDERKRNGQKKSRQIIFERLCFEHLSGDA